MNKHLEELINFVKNEKEKNVKSLKDSYDINFEDIEDIARQQYFEGQDNAFDKIIAYCERKNWIEEKNSDSFFFKHFEF
jgi:hypothetical protein